MALPASRGALQLRLDRQPRASEPTGADRRARGTGAGAALDDDLQACRVRAWALDHPAAPRQALRPGRRHLSGRRDRSGLVTDSGPPARLLPEGPGSANSQAHAARRRPGDDAPATPQPEGPGRGSGGLIQTTFELSSACDRITGVAQRICRLGVAALVAGMACLAFASSALANFHIMG